MLSVKRNAVLNVFRTLMSLIFPLITFPYVSRVLGPEGTGKVHYAQSIVSYFSMIALLGINTYGLREAAKIRDDKERLSKFYHEMMAVTLISTLTAYTLFFVAIFLFRNLYEYRQLLLVTSATILFTTIGVEWLYCAVEDYGYITLRSVFFQIAGLILLFLFVKSKDDFLQYAAVSVVTNVGSNFLNFLHCRKYVFITKKYSLEIKSHLRPILILFGTTAAISVYTVLDSTMLGVLCGDFQVGLYNAATKINKIVVGLVVAVGVVVTPRMSNIVETDRNAGNDLLLKTYNLYLFLTIPCAVGLCFLAKPVIQLFCGSEFYPAVKTMRIMTPIIIFISFGQFFTNLIFTPLRKDRYSLVPVLIGAGVNFILNLIFIPKFYALGAGVATVVAEFSVWIVKLFLSKKMTDVFPFFFKNLYQYIISALLMLLVMFLVSLVQLSAAWNLLVSVIAGAGVYVISLVLFKNEYVLLFFTFVKRRVQNACA